MRKEEFNEIKDFLKSLIKVGFIVGMSCLVIFIIGNASYLLSMLVYNNFPELLPYMVSFGGGFIIGAIIFTIHRIASA